MANVTAKVLVQDGLAAPVDDVLVRVFESDGTTFVTEELTGNVTPGSGEAEFTLFGDTPGVDYVIRMFKSGLYFPGGSVQTVNVTDPAAPDNDFGPFVAEVGPSAQLVTLVVQDDEGTPNPLSGVRVRVYDNLSTFLTEGETDVNGEVQVHLPGSASPGTTYIVRLSKDGVSFLEPTQTISVLDPLVAPDTNTFDFEGSVKTNLTAGDADLCRVYGTLANLCLKGIRGMVLEFKPIPSFPTLGTRAVRESGKVLGVYHSTPAIVQNKLIVRKKVCETDADGFFQIDLPREGCYLVHLHGLEDPIEIVEYIYVPDQANCLFTDLLYPYVSTFSFDVTTLSLSVGESVEVDFSLDLSNGQAIEDVDVVQDLLEFASSDDATVEVTLSSESSITVKGVSAGAASVSVDRRAENVVPTRPTVAALGATPISVTVS